MHERRRRWDDAYTSHGRSPKRPAPVPVRTCPRFGDEAAWQETRADANVDGTRQAVAASREIMRYRDGCRSLFISQ